MELLLPDGTRDPQSQQTVLFDVLTASGTKMVREEMSIRGD